MIVERVAAAKRLPITGISSRNQLVTESAVPVQHFVCLLEDIHPPAMAVVQRIARLVMAFRLHGRLLVVIHAYASGRRKQ
jgi:hypothetical protein